MENTGRDAVHRKSVEELEEIMAMIDRGEPVTVVWEEPLDGVNAHGSECVGNTRSEVLACDAINHLRATLKRRGFPEVSPSRLLLEFLRLNWAWLEMGAPPRRPSSDWEI